MAEELVIVDTDVGVDDAMALLLALSNPSRCRVLAITCVAGNVDLPRVYTNTLRILNFCKQLQASGASSPTKLGACEVFVQLCCSCGLGGASFAAFEQERQPESVVLVPQPWLHCSELKSLDPGEVTALPSLPASRTQRGTKIHITSMGCHFECLIIICSNIMSVECIVLFTFGSVPKISVHGSSYCPSSFSIYLPCLERLHATKPLVSWAWYDRWVSGDSPKARLVKAVTESTKQRQRHELHRRGFSCCDMLAMAAVLQPSLVTRCEAFPAWVELHGATTRGMLVVDRRPSINWNHGRPPHVQFLLGFDVEALKELYENMLR
ncbi:unnamed protein product [Ixodes persulcatus]